jgi:hypothetical protein
MNDTYTYIPNTNPKLRIAYVRVGEDYPEAVVDDDVRTWPIAGWWINPDNQAEPIPVAGLSLSDPGVLWTVVENGTRALGMTDGPHGSLRNWREYAARWLRVQHRSP